METLVWLTLSGFLAAALGPFAARRLPAPWQGAPMLALLAAVFTAGLTIPLGENLRFPWVPSLNLEFAFRFDALARLFVVIVSGIGILVFLYAGAYMKGDPRGPRLFGYLSLFAASMLGLVIADDLYVLFIFWELTSIGSYLLISLDRERPAARDGARQALLITGVGGLAMLGGVILLDVGGGPVRLSELTPAALEGVPHQGWILGLLLAGAFTKSAQFPFHTWLPRAMEAPSPVSAYLHSATMVKAGVYLLAALAPAMSTLPGWGPALQIAGGSTLAVGTALAFVHTDLKRVLAYTTVAGLGTLVFLLGLGTPKAVQAAMVFLVAHALYKGALFMLAGNVQHEAHERDLRRLGGLGKAMPWTFRWTALASLSMAGFPPLVGFLGKELALASSPLEAKVLVAVTALLTVAVALRIGWTIFRAPAHAGAREALAGAHEAPWPMLLGPGVLASLGVLFGVFLSPLGAYLADTVPPEAPPLALWHGWTLDLALSAAALALGWGVWRALSRPRELPSWPSLQQLYEATVEATLTLGSETAKRFQDGVLRNYVLVAVAVAVSLAIWPTVFALQQIASVPTFEVEMFEAAVAVVILAGIFGVVRSATRLSAVASLGVVGLGIALLYSMFGGPDLAMTQFAVEALMVVLFVLVFYRLPRIGWRARGRTRFRDASLSLLFGGLMAGLSFLAGTTPEDQPVSAYFREQSVDGGFGRNVVNVILVDFRALDTLGEITVLALAAIGVVAVLRLRPRKGGGPSHL